MVFGSLVISTGDELVNGPGCHFLGVELWRRRDSGGLLFNLIKDLRLSLLPWSSFGLLLCSCFPTRLGLLLGCVFGPLQATRLVGSTQLFGDRIPLDFPFTLVETPFQFSGRPFNYLIGISRVLFIVTGRLVFLEGNGPESVVLGFFGRGCDGKGILWVFWVDWQDGWGAGLSRCHDCVCSAMIFRKGGEGKCE